MHSGLQASRVPPARRLPFKHSDLDAFKESLKQVQTPGDGGGATVFLALESLYSMDGDFAPLTEMLDVLDEVVPKSRQCVVLDEAHSTGMYGEGGKGFAHLLGEAGGSNGRVGVRLMTFGKAVGCSGGEAHSVVGRCGIDVETGHKRYFCARLPSGASLSISPVRSSSRPPSHIPRSSRSNAPGTCSRVAKGKR